MIWVALYKRADAILQKGDLSKLSPFEQSFINSMRDRKIVWGTELHQKMMDQVENKLTA
jgi:hypothetical protein